MAKLVNGAAFRAIREMVRLDSASLSKEQRSEAVSLFRRLATYMTKPLAERKQLQSKLRSLARVVAKESRRG